MAAKIRRQRAKSPFLSPYGATPMAHVGFLESRHLHPERLPSGRKEKIVSLRLMDTSENSISNVQKLSATIRRLSVASLNLKTVPEDLIGSLLCLTKLDLSNNRLEDTSFPDCMNHLQQLVDVCLTCNNLTKVPVYVTKLKHLKRLDLCNNQLVSCQGLDKLKRLQILVMDNNKLVSVFKEISSLRRLEVLRCRENNLREISRDIRQLHSLVDLDISDNRITTVPADIFLLPKLEVFFASKNEVNKVPSFNIRPQNKHWMTHIDLSDNKLTKFPGHLLLMTFKLDLSNNKIRSIPYHVIKKMDLKTDQQLMITDNPLCYPPVDVCNSGLKSIMAFFQESESEFKVYQGLKVLVVGHHRSGKTSFVQTLVDQQSRLSEDVQEMSGGIDAYDMTYDLEDGAQEGAHGKTLELSIWDLCGHPFYMYPHYAFFEQPSVAILTFNMAGYENVKFQELIGCWINWMLAKTNKIVALLVGTQCDKLDESQREEVSRNVQEKLAQHLADQTQFIRAQIKLIEERPRISPTLSEQLKAYLKLLQTMTTVQTEVICTSAKKFVGFDKVRLAIQNFSGDRQLFPNVMRVIPTFWLDVRHFIEDRGNSMTLPVLTWQQFEDEVTSRFGMKHLTKIIAQYLHETGQVIWFSNVQTLKGLVFIRPSWLFDVLRLTLRHDLESSVFTPEDTTVSLVGLTSMKFERLKKEVLTEGVLDRDIIRCLLAPLVPNDYSSFITEVMKLLTGGFELGYYATNSQKDATQQSVSTKDSQESRKLNKIVVPWLKNNSEPEEFTTMWDSLKSKNRLACCLSFPLYLPPGLFETACVHAHNEKHKLQFLHQWGGGLHAVQLEEKVHVLVTYIQNGNGDCGDMSKMLKFEVRDDLSGREEDSPNCTMWKVLLPLLLDFEQLLANYSGVLVERLTECPMCQCASFIGEWLTPKETQSLATRTCESCQQEIDTAYLVQPREQKRVIIRRKNSTTSKTTRVPSLLPMLTTVAEDSKRKIKWDGHIQE